MNLFDLADEVIALTRGVRKPAGLPADIVAVKHAETVESAIRLGFSRERAAEVADESWRTLSELADALYAAGQAARAVNAMSKKHNEELRNRAHAD